MDVAAYHERTKHRFERYAAGPETLDWHAQPDPFRRFSGCVQRPLPLMADDYAVPYADLYKAGVVTARPVQRNTVALLLEISLGLSAWKQYGTDRWSLRCNPSSGNLHPTEAYVVAGGVAGLDDGVYHYRVDEHLLERRCRFVEGGEPVLLLGLTSIHWREAWKYGERAYRYCQLDVGHAVAAVAFAAAALGWTVTPLLNWSDEALARLLGTDRQADFGAAEAEHADVLLAISSGPAASPDAAALLARAAAGQWQGHANVLDPRHLYDWPAIDEVAAAAVKPETVEAPDAGADAWPPPLPGTGDEPAARLFRRRRSAQAFDGATPLDASTFYRYMDRLLPRSLPALPWAPRVHPILFVHRVDGLASGLYALPRRGGAVELLKTALRDEFDWQPVADAPAHLPLFHLVSANAQRTAARLSCHQAIAADSAFSLAMLAEFAPTLAGAPWRYRHLFWEAGALGQILYLEAETDQRRGTGIGCFFDDAVHELLGITDDGLQSLYHFTVGTALHDPRIASLPAYGHLKSNRA